MQFEGEREKWPLNFSRSKTALSCAGPLDYGCWTCAGYRYAQVARTVARYVGHTATPLFLAQMMRPAVMLKNAVMSHLLTIWPYTPVALLAESSWNRAATSAEETAMLQRCSAEAATEWVSSLTSVELLARFGSMILWYVEKGVSLLVGFSRQNCIIHCCPNEKHVNCFCLSSSHYTAHWTQLFYYASIIP